MLTVIDNKDIQFHFKQLKEAGKVPAQVELDTVAFERGGSILVDAGIKVPLIGTIDVKLTVVAKLLSDLKTIRFRVVELKATKVVSVSLRGIIMQAIKEAITNLDSIPGLRWVNDGDDGYCEYRRPQEWILMRDIQTNDNRLSIVLDGFDIPKAMEEFRLAEIERMKTSNSMADKINVKALEAK